MAVPSATKAGPAGADPSVPHQIGPTLLHRDALMLVVDKPAGLPVHPGPGGGPTLTDALDGLRFGLPRRPEAAHRLDRDTSGCLVLGRHARALARLNALFAAGEVAKTYWALVEGGPTDDEGEVALPLARRSPDRRSWWMRADPAGRPALTRWRVLGRGEGGDGAPGTPLAWLALEPVTGRTHQLRVHCAESGWPIRGDAIYGGAPRRSPGTGSGREPGLALHARAVGVPLRPGRPAITVAAPAPLRMRRGLTACGWCDDPAEASGAGTPVRDAPR